MIAVARKPAQLVFFSAVATVAGVLIWLSLLRHYRFASTQDLALFDQLLWNIRQGHGIWTTMSGNSWLQFPHHFFGEHVAPVLYLLAYPAALAPGPEILLIVQALVVALAAIPAARIMAAETGWRPAGIFAGLAWLAFPGIWGAVLFDFHMEAFEPLFLFAFWLSLRRGRLACWLWAGLYMACKEDAPFYLAAVALAGGFITQHRRLGMAVCLAALAYGLLVWLWVQPACSPAGKALLGQRLMLPAHAGDIAPWIQRQFLNPSRWQALGGHLLAFGLLPVFAGVALLPWAMSLGVMWLSNDYEQSHGLLHYPLTLYPLLFLAAAIGMRHLRQWLQPRGPVVRRVCCGMIMGLGLAGIGMGWVAGKEAVINAAGKVNTAALRQAPARLAAIPPDGDVCAALTLSPHLSRRRNIAILMDPATNAEWIATRLDGIVHPCQDHQEWLVSQLLSDRSAYGVVAFETNFIIVFRRGYPQALNRQVLENLLSTVQAEDFLHHTGHVVRDGNALDGLAFMFSPRDADGFALFGYYLDLPAGTYEVTFRVRARAPRPCDFARLEVTENCGRNIRAQVAIRETLPHYTNLVLQATLSGDGGVEFRIRKTGSGYLWADQVAWKRQPSPPRTAPP